MMAKTEDRFEEDRPATGKALALSALLGFAALLALCMLAGVAAAFLDDGKANWPGVAIVAGLALLVGGGAVWGLRRLKPWAIPREPVSPTTRKANNLLLVSAGLGGVMGGALALGTIGSDDPFALFSNSPLAPAIVVPAIVAWLLGVLISLQWHRKVDEHEARAYEFGGMAGLYLYAFAAPAWWLAWRGGLLPAPDTMVIFAVVMLVWCAGWFWRR